MGAKKQILLPLSKIQRELIIAHRKIPERLAKRYASSRHPYEDLLSPAYEELCISAIKWNSKITPEFGPYAHMRVWRAIWFYFGEVNDLGLNKWIRSNGNREGIFSQVMDYPLNQIYERTETKGYEVEEYWLDLTEDEKTIARMLFVQGKKKREILEYFHLRYKQLALIIDGMLGRIKERCER